MVRYCCVRGGKVRPIVRYYWKCRVCCEVLMEIGEKARFIVRHYWKEGEM